MKAIWLIKHISDISLIFTGSGPMESTDPSMQGWISRCQDRLGGELPFSCTTAYLARSFSFLPSMNESQIC
jgi:hypothetical protein